MFQINKSKIFFQGIVNLTPDSFSDGAQSNTTSGLKQKIEMLSDCDIYDFGAESTAPFNEAISFSKEVQRLDSLLLPALKNLKGKKISLDTYKISTIEWFLKSINISDYEEVIWNDVSGILDEKTISILKSNPKLSYVYSHCLVDKRENVSKHMDFVAKELDLIKYFNKASFKLKGLGNKVYYDPCFGFSKSRAQNHELLINIQKILMSVDHPFWLIGISRKSFLRFSNLDKKDIRLIFEAELMQSHFLNELMNFLDINERSLELLIRIHDPIVYKTFMRFYNLKHELKKD